MEPDAFDEQRWDLLEFESCGESVLLRHRTTARGAGSGIEVTANFWTVWTFEDGLVLAIQAFHGHEKTRAMAAAGLTDP